MKIYADTSVLIAWFHPVDPFAPAVTSWCQKQSPEFIWNLLLRIELRHHLRRLTTRYASTAWHAYRMSEMSQRLRLSSHRLPDSLEWGDELSARYSLHTPAGSWDFVNVAAAQHARADIFATCDAAQADLARLAGLKRVHQFE